jgi:hypothetical protein
MLALAGVLVVLNFGRYFSTIMWAIAVALPLIQALLGGVLAVSRVAPEEG